jgi:hypothetical protein
MRPSTVPISNRPDPAEASADAEFLTPQHGSGVDTNSEQHARVQGDVHQRTVDFDGGTGRRAIEKRLHGQVVGD